MNLSCCIQTYIDYLTSISNFSSHSIRAYKGDLNNFCSFVKKKEFSGTIDKKFIRSYIAHLSDNYDPRSIARRLSAMRSFFKFAVAQGWIQDNPMGTLASPKTAKKLPYLLTKEQVTALIESPNTSSYLGLRDRTILEVLYSSALRVSELTALNKKDICFVEMFIKVHGKGKKERFVPITDACAFWLKKYITAKERFTKTNLHKTEHDKKAVFLNRWGTRITPRSIDRLFAFYVGKRCLPKEITPHDMRHSIATHLLDNGMGLDAIRKLLGHENINTTTIYTQVSLSKKLKEYDNCFPAKEIFN